MNAQDVVIAAAPTGKAGPVALFVIVLLCVAAYFLFRSLSRHLGRVPVDFDPAMGTSTAAPVEPPAPAKAGKAAQRASAHGTAKQDPTEPGDGPK